MYPLSEHKIIWPGVAINQKWISYFVHKQMFICSNNFPHFQKFRSKVRMIIMNIIIIICNNLKQDNHEEYTSESLLS